MRDIVLVDKPKDWTSFDVVAKLRSKLRVAMQNANTKPTKKQLRVGHAGTLDPFATGLLIILFGDGCKKATEFLKLDKTYIFTAKLGEVSSTGDPEGVITVTSSKKPSQNAVEGALKGLTGQLEQKPPMYSAIKIGGRRAYKLAREGKKVEMPTRSVQIARLNLVDYQYPYLKCECDVSSGTYIRTLVEDIGAALQTGAYCMELRRTRIGTYRLEDAVTIEDTAALI